MVWFGLLLLSLELVPQRLGTDRGKMSLTGHFLSIYYSYIDRNTYVEFLVLLEDEVGQLFEAAGCWCVALLVFAVLLLDRSFLALQRDPELFDDAGGGKKNHTDVRAWSSTPSR